MPISLLRIRRIASPPSGTRSRPCQRMRPATMRPGGIAISFNTDIAVTVLPQPLSPTTPRVSPASIARSTSSTACTIPSSVANCTFKPWISSRWRDAGCGSRAAATSHHLARVERVAQTVADEVDRQHRQEDCRPGEKGPMRRDVEIVLGVKQEAARGRDIGWKAEAEKGQRRLGDDRDRDVDRAGDDDRPQRIRQDVAHYQPQFRGAERPRRLDELLLAQRQ